MVFGLGRKTEGSKKSESKLTRRLSEASAPSMREDLDSTRSRFELPKSPSASPGTDWTRLDPAATFAPAGGSVASLASLSHGGYAAERSKGLLDAVLGELQHLDASVVPHNRNLRSARKAVLYLRDHLDLFVHVYAQGPESEKWLSLRRELDQGYRVLGQYKDLFDAQGLSTQSGELRPGVKEKDLVYDLAQLEERREAMLSWMAGFQTPAWLDDVRAFIDSPKSQPAAVEDVPLSSFFWRNVAKSPSAKRTGVENVRRLAMGLLQLALEEQREILELKRPYGKGRDEQFHDFRKRLRSLMNLLKSHELLLPPGAASEAALERLSKAAERCGKIEDRLLSLSAAKEKGAERKVRQLEKQLESEWPKFVEWAQSSGLSAQLEQLRELLATASP